MKLGFRLGRASKRSLLAHAESLVDDQRAVSAHAAAEIAGDPEAAAEVKAMRATLAAVKAADPLEPSSDLEARILMEARKVRQDLHREEAGRSNTLVAFRAAACAAGLVVVGAVVFATLLHESDSPVTATAIERPAAVQPMVAESDAPSPESIRKAASDVETLAAAVRDKAGANGSAAEQEQLRAVNAMDADISAALDALERNPGCVRAGHVVHSNLREQAETLRSLYVNRSL
jgi:hypothetical protein